MIKNALKYSMRSQVPVSPCPMICYDYLLLGVLDSLLRVLRLSRHKKEEADGGQPYGDSNENDPREADSPAVGSHVPHARDHRCHHGRTIHGGEVCAEIELPRTLSEFS